MSVGKILLIATFLLLGFTAAAMDDDPATGATLEIESPESTQILLLGEDKPLETKDALPGTFILPEAPGQDTKGEKCMTVCARWGEDCLLINKGVGGMERKCRRTCKQFAEECF